MAPKPTSITAPTKREGRPNVYESSKVQDVSWVPSLEMVQCHTMNSSLVPSYGVTSEETRVLESEMVRDQVGEVRSFNDRELTRSIETQQSLLGGDDEEVHVVETMTKAERYVLPSRVSGWKDGSSLLENERETIQSQARLKRKYIDDTLGPLLATSSSQLNDLSIGLRVAVLDDDGHWRSAVISEIGVSEGRVGVTFRHSLTKWFKPEHVHPIFKVTEGSNKGKEGWICSEDIGDCVWLRAAPRSRSSRLSQPAEQLVEFRVCRSRLLPCQDATPDNCSSNPCPSYLTPPPQQGASAKVLTPLSVGSSSAFVTPPLAKRLCVDGLVSLANKAAMKQLPMHHSYGGRASIDGCEDQLHRIGGEMIDRTLLKSTEGIPCTFAEHFFRGRMRVLEKCVTWGAGTTGDKIKGASRKFVVGEGTVNESHYELLLTKLHRENGYTFGQTKCRVTSHYVCVHGPGLPTISLQAVLESLADFGSLKPGKAAARLQLFQTPAMNAIVKSQKGKLIFDEPLSSEDFEIIDEKCNEGCGFIPRSYLEMFCGKTVVGQRVKAIQVRIFGTNLGVFKGLLVEKEGISRIQLPPSMRKVGPCQVQGNDRVVVLIKGRFPSKTSIYVGRAVKPELNNPPPASFQPRTVSKMILRQWKEAGLSEKTIRKFTTRRRDFPQKLRESYVVGVADPTGKIPPCSVFITGLPENVKKFLYNGKVFVTRMPCMSASDGVLVRLVVTKPKKMPKAQWDFLNSFGYGFIIFGDSNEGKVPLPNRIAGGDLDGDLYFICWDGLILSELGKALGKTFPRLVLEDKPAEEPKKSIPYDPNWLKNAQEKAGDLAAIVAVHTLLSKLYNRSVETENPKDKDVLGKAYQQAIDLQKHGGKVSLPRRLWEKVPQSLHEYLQDADEEDHDSVGRHSKDTPGFQGKNRVADKTDSEKMNENVDKDLVGASAGAATVHRCLEDTDHEDEDIEKDLVGEDESICSVEEDHGLVDSDECLAGSSGIGHQCLRDADDEEEDNEEEKEKDLIDEDESICSVKGDHDSVKGADDRKSGERPDECLESAGTSTGADACTSVQMCRRGIDKKEDTGKDEDMEKDQVDEDESICSVKEANGLVHNAEDQEQNEKPDDCLVSTDAGTSASVHKGIADADKKKCKDEDFVGDTGESIYSFKKNYELLGRTNDQDTTEKFDEPFVGVGVGANMSIGHAEDDDEEVQHKEKNVIGEDERICSVKQAHYLVEKTDDEQKDEASDEHIVGANAAAAAAKFSTRNVDEKGDEDKNHMDYSSDGAPSDSSSDYEDDPGEDLDDDLGDVLGGKLDEDLDGALDREPDEDLDDIDLDDLDDFIADDENDDISIV